MNTKNKRKNKKNRTNKKNITNKKKRTNVSLQSNKEFPALPTKKIVQKKVHNNHIIYKKAHKGYTYLQSLPLLDNSFRMTIFY